VDKPLLDEYCKNIFSLLLVSDKALRFNELKKDLNDLGLKMSPPTLIEHLHHLQRHRVITRKREGRQNVSYRVNWERFETLKESMDYRKRILHILENEKRFKSFPIDEQAIYTTNILTLTGLYRLKLEIQDAIDPTKNFEHSLEFLLINRFFEFFKTWLLENCRSSTENAQVALNTIEFNIDHVQNQLFDKISKPS
jgi:DNA-binding HxlR family transcriptional regulator